ncbi:MAG: hypothetical protein DLM54_03370 [Acidimicrobiales bacterium]|nr:MAG: hypothetical protein DLM54_03370 [Acidimicrobiales bacterium]
MRLDQLAQRQYGVISRAQALTAGFVPSQIACRCRSGAWERVAPGVYRLTGTVPSWHQQLMTAILRMGRDAVVSHLAAAGLWELDGVPPGTVEVSVGRAGRRHQHDVVIHRTRRPRSHRPHPAGRLAGHQCHPDTDRSGRGG